MVLALLTAASEPRHMDLLVRLISRKKVKTRHDEGKMNMETMPVVFEDRKVRRVLHDGEWYFAVADVVAALTEN